MYIEEIMSYPVTSVDMDSSLEIVKMIFDSTHFHHLIVGKVKIQGIISDRDLLRSISPNAGTEVATSKDEAFLKKKVHQIMTRKPITLGPKASIEDAIMVFDDHKVSCIPIVNDRGYAIGIVSWRDILKALKPCDQKQNKAI